MILQQIKGALPADLLLLANTWGIVVVAGGIEIGHGHDAIGDAV